MTEPGAGEDLPRPKVTPKMVLTEDDLGNVVADLEQTDLLVIDVETVNGLDPLTNLVTWVGLGTGTHVHLIPMGHPNGDLRVPAHVAEVPDMSTVRPYKNNPEKFTKPKMNKVKVPARFYPAPRQLRPDMVMEALGPFLFSEKITKVGHNLGYDLKSLRKYFRGKPIPGPYYDTLVASHVCNENIPAFTLKNLTSEYYLGPRGRKAEVRDAYYPNLGKDINAYSISDIARYLAKDISYTRWLMGRTSDQMYSEGLEDAFRLEMDLFPVLMDMEYTGVHVDQSRVRQLKEELEKSIHDLEVEAWTITGVQFELTNNNRKREFLFELPKSEGGQKLPVRGRTKTGMAKVDADTLKEFKSSNRLVEVFLEYSELSKLLTSFVEKFASGEILYEGKVHTSFKQHGTVTGRLSSAQPNLQQIPAHSEIGKLFREAFSSSKGRKIVCADYDQIELRCMAYISGDKEMTRLFRDGEDIHRGAAAGAFGIDFEDVTDEQRSVGKTVNFLIGYGGGAAKLASEIGRPANECQKIIDRYYERFPGLARMKADIIRMAAQTGSRENPDRHPPYIEIPPFGRRRRVPGLFSPDEFVRFKAQRQVVNAVIQGFASNIMKLAMIKLSSVLEEADVGAQLVLTVHDEVLVDAEESSADEVYSLVVEAMQGVRLADGPILGTEIPLLASGGVGDNWVEAK